MARDTALAWREMAESPKDQELLVKGGHYQIAAETYPEWYEAKGVALVQWREHDGWRGEMCDGDYIWYRPTQFITVADLLAQSGTEPPQSINSGLLEAAKETASFIRNCNGGSRGERINLDRLANLLEVAISNAEKAISIAKAEREMGEG